MAAFTWGRGCPDPKPQKAIWIRNQPAMYLNNPQELLDAINTAERDDCDTVYIVDRGKHTTHIGIELWYAKALYGRLIDEDSRH